MTKKLVNAAVLAAVLALAVMAPSTTFAAGHGSPVVTVASHGPSLFEMFLNLIGFNTVKGNDNGSKNRPAPSPFDPTSTDTATWGGRCPLCQ
jgi:hypothetical protein